MQTLPSRRTSRNFAITLAITLVTVVSCSAGTGETADALVSQARAYYADGQLSAAVIELKNALQQEPQQVEARMLLGQVYLASGDGASAEKELRRAFELGAPGERVLVPLGRALLLQGKSETVLTDLTLDGKEWPDELAADLLVLRGNAHAVLDDSEQAQASFTRALERTPGNNDARLGLARVALTRNDEAAAQRHLDAILQDDPKHVRAWLIEGDRRLAAQDLRGAHEAYAKALEIDPSVVLARLGLAVAASREGRHEDALREADAVLKARPKLAQANFLKGQTLLALGRPDAAREPLGEVLLASPEHLPSHLLLAVIQLSAGELNQADSHAARVHARVPNHVPAAKVYATIKLRLGDVPGAIEILETARSQAPDDTALLATLGSAYLQEGRYEDGTALLERAMKLAPEMRGLRTRLAFGELAQGRTEQAVSHLESAVELGTDPVTADYYLVQTRIRGGELDEALEAARAFQSRAPDNPAGHLLLADVYAAKGDMDGARRSAERAAQLRPDKPGPLLKLAQLAQRAEDPEGAAGYYQRVLEHDPKNIAAMLALAQLAAQAQQSQEAHEWLERAWAVNPGDMRVGLPLYGSYSRRRDFGSALEVAREMAERHPDNADALRALGAARLANGNATSAVTDFQQLVELQPDRARNYLLLGTAQVRAQQPQEAETSLRKALELEADLLPAKILLGELLVRTDRANEAVAIAQELQREHPDRVEGHRLAAIAYQRTQRLSESAAAFEQMLQRAPSEPIALQTAAAYARAGDTGSAARVAESWLQAHPESVQMRTALGNLLLAESNNDAAITEFEAVVERDPQAVVALNNLAYLYQLRGDPRRLSYAERAHAAAQDNPAVIDTLGWILVSDGEIERGLRLLERAVSLAPHIASIRYHRAVAYERNGKQKQAIRELDELLRSEQPFPEREQARELLGELRNGS